MKKKVVATDKIGEKIGLSLYREFSKTNLTQTELAKRIGIRQSAVSGYFNGKVTTANIEQYWKIAEAIPISRQEFDQIVESAKREVVGISEQNSGTKINRDMAISFLAHDENVSENDIKQALRAIKLFKSGQ